MEVLDFLNYLNLPLLTREKIPQHPQPITRMQQKEQQEQQRNPLHSITQPNPEADEKINQSIQ